MSACDWSPQDVADQLKTVGLGKYGRNFVTQGVTGEALLRLTDGQLRDLGLPAPARMTAMNWIKCLPAGRREAPAKRSTATPGGARAAPGRTAAKPAPKAAPARAAPTKAAPARAAPTKAAPAPGKAAVPKKSGFVRPGALGKGRGGNMPMEIQDEGGPDDRVPCRYCNRRFAPDRIAMHEGPCARMSKKRRVFDAKKQRLSGTEAARYQSRSKEPAKPAKQMIGGRPKYIVEHENLVASMRAARRMAAYEDARAAGKAKGPPPPMPKMQEVPDDRVLCKFCGRKFGEVQYERHVRTCGANQPIPPSRGRAGARGGTRARGRGRI